MRTQYIMYMSSLEIKPLSEPWVQQFQWRETSSWSSAGRQRCPGCGAGTHLNVHKHAVVSLIQHLAALDMQRKFKGNLSLATGELSWLQHVDGAVENLDRLSTQIIFSHQHIVSVSPWSHATPEDLDAPELPVCRLDTISKLLLFLSLHNNGSLL